MWISDVKGTILAPPEFPGGAFLLVEVESNDGLKGFGEGFAYSLYGESAHAAKTILDKGLKSILIDEDPLEIERLHESQLAKKEETKVSESEHTKIERLLDEMMLMISDDRHLKYVRKTNQRCLADRIYRVEDHDHDYYFICEIKPDAKDLDNGIGKLIRYKYELRKELKKKGKEGDVITILVSNGDIKYWSRFCPQTQTQTHTEKGRRIQHSI